LVPKRVREKRENALFGLGSHGGKGGKLLLILGVVYGEKGRWGEGGYQNPEGTLSPLTEKKRRQRRQEGYDEKEGEALLWFSEGREVGEKTHPGMRGKTRKSTFRCTSEDTSVKKRKKMHGVKRNRCSCKGEKQDIGKPFSEVVQHKKSKSMGSKRGGPKNLEKKKELIP